MQITQKNNKKFIERTLHALEQYEAYLPDEKQSYGRTLFINACVGLLIVPQSSYYSKIPNDDICNWGLSRESIIKGGDKKTKDVLRHLRNSIAHNHFHFDCGDEYTASVPIREITFIDIRPNTNEETFRATFKFNEFKTFVLKISHYVINE